MADGMNDVPDPRRLRHSEQTSPPPGPDWERISFDVPCTRCGANLRGQSEPLCPTCGLRFDWGRLLPLDDLRCEKCAYQLFALPEQRCPECGTAFHWAEVLAAARSRGSRLFEFVWSTDPLRGFFRSVYLAALRPRKLWAEYHVRVPPRFLPLLLFTVAQWLLFARGWHVVAWLGDPAMNAVATWIGSPLTFVYRFRVGPLFLPSMAMWYVVSFASLQLLFQTKRRLDIRWLHTLRVYAHATVFASLCTVGWCVSEMLLDATLFVSPTLIGASPAAYSLLAQAVFAVGLLATWAHLWIGLHYHLKVPRGWLVAAACLLIGYLISAPFSF